MCTFVLNDELRRLAWRAVTSFDFPITVCCSTDVMTEIFVVTLHDLKHGCMHSWRHGELRRVATCSDELWISYCGEKCMLYYRCNDGNIFSSLYMTSNVDVYICAVWRAVTNHGVLWQALNLVLRWRVYVGLLVTYNEICFITLHDLKRGCVHSCGMTSCDVLWGVLNFVLLWKIYVVLQM
jgi:hypothetical protein